MAYKMFLTVECRTLGLQLNCVTVLARLEHLVSSGLGYIDG
jgi:hypothetical protein